MPPRILRATFSHISACAPASAGLIPSSESPPVLARALWQVTQYFWTSAGSGSGAARAHGRGCRSGDGCGGRRRAAARAVAGVPTRTLRLLGEHASRPGGQTSRQRAERTNADRRRGCKPFVHLGVALSASLSRPGT